MASATLRLRKGVTTWVATDDETVLLDLDEVRYLGLNHSAAVLWAMLAAGTTRDDLIARLESEFDIPTEQATSDVDAFLSQCATRGYLDS